MGGILAGLLAGFSFLGKIAGDIASGFKWETDQYDLRNGPGWEYFTRENLEAQGQKILGTLGSEGKTFGVAAWAGILGSIVGGAGINIWGPQLLEQAKNLVKGGVTTSVVTMIIVAAGSVIMSNIASNDIAQEVSDAS